MSDSKMWNFLVFAWSAFGILCLIFFITCLFSGKLGLAFVLFMLSVVAWWQTKEALKEVSRHF